MWGQAEGVLRQSRELLVFGYSFSDADPDEQTLILKHTNCNAKISIYSLEQSECIARKFRENGFANVNPVSTIRFEEWVKNCGELTYTRGF